MLGKAKAQWQECEMAGHIASAVQKQSEVNAGAQITFSLPLPTGRCHSCSRCVLSPRLTALKTPSQTNPEMYPLVNSKSSQGINGNSPSLAQWLMLELHL